MKTITIDGVAYVPADSVPAPTTSGRQVLVIDRGWIIAGDVEETADGVTLYRPTMLQSFQSIGFSGAIADPRSESVTLQQMTAPVVVPRHSIIFRVPVDSDWGRGE